MTTEKTTANIGFAIWRLNCFYQTFVQGSAAVILLKFFAKNPSHRRAENSWMLFHKIPLEVSSVGSLTIYVADFTKHWDIPDLKGIWTPAGSHVCKKY
jgi:hypothetical protein